MEVTMEEAVGLSGSGLVPLLRYLKYEVNVCSLPQIQPWSAPAPVQAARPGSG